MCDSVKNLQRGRIFWIIQVGPTCDHKGLNKGQREAGGGAVREDVTELRSGRREDAVPLAQMGGGVKPKMHVDPRSWKGQGHEVSPLVLQGMQPHRYLVFKILTSRS